MTKTAVIVDSTAAIPLTKQHYYHIQEVPIPILFGQDAYLGNRDLHTVPELMQVMAEHKVLPTTSQPAPAAWEAALTQAKQDGYDQAVIVTLSAGISGAYQTASAVAAGFEGLPVAVIDSHLTNMAEGAQALLAAALGEQGASLPAIEAAVADFQAHLGARFVVDDISHLKRTGRLSRGQALVGGLLNIKPLLAFDIQGDGKIGAVGKARKMSGALSIIRESFDDYLKQADYPVRAYILDANNDKLAEKWAKELTQAYPTVQFERYPMDPVITVHTGEKAMALLWSKDWTVMAADK
ncbi:DegV family protein [Leuconostocaceae bacterium ESL0958]|nr:DegV family protein [Leuconostocaceae bacterium ESL0958]